MQGQAEGLGQLRNIRNDAVLPCATSGNAPENRGCCAGDTPENLSVDTTMVLIETIQPLQQWNGDQLSFDALRGFGLTELWPNLIHKKGLQ